MAIDVKALSGYGASKFLAENSGATSMEWVAGTGSGNVVRATSPTLVTPVLGTPSSGTLTSCTGLPISTGVAGLGSGVATALATPSLANFNSMLSDADFATLAGSETLTNKTLTTPVINVGSDATGDIYYRNSGGAFTRLAAGTNGHVLTLSGGIPSWASGGGGGGSSYDESSPILDSSSNELLKFAKVTSAVNEFTMSNNSTGNAPILSATGGDTNTGISIEPKGTGALSLWTVNGSAGLIIESGSYGSRFASTYRTTIRNDFGETIIAKFGGQALNFAGGGGTFCEFRFQAPYARAAFGTIPTFQLYTPTELTGDQNNYDASTNERAPVWRMSSNASRNVTGLTFSFNGAWITWVNVGTNNIVIKHEDAASTAANRFLCSTGADITLSGGQRADLWYDATSARWRVWKIA